MISVLILTKNEASDLPGCLQSVAWSDDVHVFDSLSSDRTVELAQRAGAKVSQRAFDGYASQRNAALTTLPFKYEWLLILDADERVPEAMAREMRAFVGTAQADVSAARMRRRDFLFGTWLKHAQISPWFIRLVRPSKVRYEREINEVLRVDGVVRDLVQPFDHFPFSKGIAHWVEKHNTYSSMEAQIALRAGREDHPVSLAAALFDRDFNVRRFHQKALFYRMPCRPFIKWCYMVLWRRAFLDGRAGLTYAFLQSFYEYLIVVKTRELRMRSRESAPDGKESGS